MKFVMTIIHRPSKDCDELWDAITKSNMNFPAGSHIPQKFLTQSNNDVSKTLAKLEEYLAWKNQLQLPQFPKEKTADFYERGFWKTDKEGRPLYVHLINTFNWAEFHKCTESEAITAIIGELEFLNSTIFPEIVKAKGICRSEINLLIDLKGLNMKLLSNKKLESIVMTLTPLLQTYYPNYLHKGFLINAPIMFNQFWDEIESSIPESTLSKLQIIGSKGIEQMAEIIPPNTIPVDYGGLWEGEFDFRCIEGGGQLINEESSGEEEMGAVDEDEEDNLSKFDDLRAQLSMNIPDMGVTKNRFAEDDDYPVIVMADFNLGGLMQDGVSKGINATPLNTQVEEDGELQI